MENIEYISTPIDGLKTKLPITAASVLSSAGFNHASRQASLRYKIKLNECMNVWLGFMAGEVDPFIMKEAFRPTKEFAFRQLQVIAPTIFHEAMTRSDFTNLTTYVLDRMMLDNYASFPMVYTQIAKVNRKVRDFRSIERWVTDGGERSWQLVGELDGFNRDKVDTSKYNYTVAKYEGGAQVSWEAYINDDMEMFKDLATRLALGGWRTIELFFTKLIADANGPIASFYTSGNGNIIDTSNYAGGSVNPVLNYNNLAGALAQYMNLKTSDGRPINMATDQVSVMVGDGMLYQTLLNIINTAQIATTVAGGSKGSSAVTADTTLTIRNWIAGRINPIFNPELRNVVTASSGAVAAKSWWIFPPPNSLGRPVVEIGHLNGFDTPQLFRKMPNTQHISGGSADEMGDFEYMATEIKGMTVVGGTRIDPKGTLASNGSGS